jgi:hypothetical protein
MKRSKLLPAFLLFGLAGMPEIPSKKDVIEGEIRKMGSWVEEYVESDFLDNKRTKKLSISVKNDILSEYFGIFSDNNAAIYDPDETEIIISKKDFDGNSRAKLSGIIYHEMLHFVLSEQSKILNSPDYFGPSKDIMFSKAKENIISQEEKKYIESNVNAWLPDAYFGYALQRFASVVKISHTGLGAMYGAFNHLVESKMIPKEKESKINGDYMNISNDISTIKESIRQIDDSAESMKNFNKLKMRSDRLLADVDELERNIIDYFTEVEDLFPKNDSKEDISKMYEELLISSKKLDKIRYQEELKNIDEAFKSPSEYLAYCLERVANPMQYDRQVPSNILEIFDSMNYRGKKVFPNIVENYRKFTRSGQMIKGKQMNNYSILGNPHNESPKNK